MSLRAISSQLGLGSLNYLSLILEGKRRLNIETAIKFSDFMGLNQDESAYFVTLVEITESKSAIEQGYYKNRLKQLITKKPENSLSDAKSLASNWKNPIILMLIADQSVNEAVTAVAKIFTLSRSDAKNMIYSLIEQKMVKEVDGKLKLEAMYFKSRDAKSKKNAYHEFLKKHVELLDRAIGKSYSEKSKHVIQVLGMNSDRAPEIFSKIDRTVEEVAGTIESDKVESVYVLQLHCVPIERYL